MRILILGGDGMLGHRVFLELRGRHVPHHIGMKAGPPGCVHILVRQIGKLAAIDDIEQRPDEREGAELLRIRLDQRADDLDSGFDLAVEVTVPGFLSDSTGASLTAFATNLKPGASKPFRLTFLLLRQRRWCGARINRTGSL